MGKDAAYLSSPKLKMRDVIVWIRKSSDDDPPKIDNILIKQNLIEGYQRTTDSTHGLRYYCVPSNFLQQYFPLCRGRV